MLIVFVLSFFPCRMCFLLRLGGHFVHGRFGNVLFGTFEAQRRIGMGIGNADGDLAAYKVVEQPADELRASPVPDEADFWA